MANLKRSVKNVRFSKMRQTIAQGLSVYLLPRFPALAVISILTTVLLSVQDLSCPICLRLIDNPMSTKCNHFYCSKCINGALDNDNKCPQCREVSRAVVKHA